MLQCTTEKAFILFARVQECSPQCEYTWELSVCAYARVAVSQSINFFSSIILLICSSTSPPPHSSSPIGLSFSHSNCNHFCTMTEQRNLSLFSIPSPSTPHLRTPSIHLSISQSTSAKTWPLYQTETKSRRQFTCIARTSREKSTEHTHTHPEMRINIRTQHIIHQSNLYAG